MLEALCGNKNIGRILLFLFVNGRCYGTQLQRLLRTPLTPLQNALSRLERGGIITSYTEGKTRLYQFNPAFPLLPELEQLLKKTYTLLPAQEKRLYATVQEQGALKDKMSVLVAFWKRLAQVRHLSFQAKSKSEEAGWNGKGRGEVVVTPESDHTLIFQEKGTWQDKKGGSIDFSNVFRWTFDRHTVMISLEHLRRGANHPVFLFHLVPTGAHSLASVDSHLCDGDVYFGKLHFDPHSLRLNWRVIGPRKNEEIDYYYV